MKKGYAKELEGIARLSRALQPIELGALLTRLFQERQVRLTIVGGAAVQFYTQAEYVTKDLDAILHNDETKDIEEVMGCLGFKRTTTYRHFEHPLFKFVVEFPPSPVEVGNRHIVKYSQMQTSLGPVNVIKVEDIILDRIIAGVEWKQPDRLAQARLLWLKCQSIIDKKYLKQFAKEEGYEKELKKIMT